MIRFKKLRTLKIQFKLKKYFHTNDLNKVKKLENLRIRITTCPIIVIYFSFSSPDLHISLKPDFLQL